jgi:hypothetical protein
MREGDGRGVSPRRVREGDDSRSPRAKPRWVITIWSMWAWELRCARDAARQSPGWLTIAVSENRYLTQIAKRTVLSEDALSILVPIMDDIMGCGADS